MVESTSFHHFNPIHVHDHVPLGPLAISSYFMLMVKELFSEEKKKEKQKKWFCLECMWVVKTSTNVEGADRPFFFARRRDEERCDDDGEKTKAKLHLSNLSWTASIAGSTRRHRCQAVLTVNFQVPRHF